MDLSQLSTEDLIALRSGDLTKVSTDGLQKLQGATRQAPKQQDTPNPVVGAAYGLARAARDVIDAPALWMAKGADALGLTRGEAQRVSDINKRAEADYQAATPGSVSAGVARTLGAVGSAFLPGTGQVGAARKIAGLWDGGNTLGRTQALAGAAGLGAAQSAALGTRTLDDSALGQAGMGAAFGAGGQLVGPALNAGVQLVRNLKSGSAGTAGRVLSDAAEMAPADLMARILAGNRTLVPGSAPTTVQAAMVPGMSRLQAGVRAYAPNDFAAVSQAQNAARLAAVDGIAPGAQGRTSVEALKNLGDMAAAEAGAGRDAIKALERQKYGEAAASGAELLLPAVDRAKTLLKQFYPRGPIPSDPHGSALHAFVDAMDGTAPVSLAEFDALRKQAGNKARALSRGVGESDPTAAAAWSSIKGLFDDAESAALAKSEQLTPTGRGPFGPVYGGLTGDADNAVAHLLRMQSGEVPGALSHAQVKEPIDLIWGRPETGKSDGAGLAKLAAFHEEALPDLQGLLNRTTVRPEASGTNRLRMAGPDGEGAVVSLNWRGDPKIWLLSAFERPLGKAGRSMNLPGAPEGGATASAPAALRSSMPDIEASFKAFADQVNPPAQLRDPRQYTGDLLGALLPEQAAPLKAGRSLRVDRKKTYEEGPLMYAWRTGADGMPQAQGAELGAKLVHSGKTQVEDLAALKRAVLERGPTMRAAKDYAITDLLERATQRGADADMATLLPSKYGAWMDNRAGMLRGLLDGGELGTLRNVGADLNRAARAETLGQGSGSNTAEKLLSVGLLDSPWADRGLALLPNILGLRDISRGALGAVKESGRRKTAQDVAKSLIEQDEALRVLQAYAGLLVQNQWQRNAPRLITQTAAPAGVLAAQD